MSFNYLIVYSHGRDRFRRHAVNKGHDINTSHRCIATDENQLYKSGTDVACRARSSLPVFFRVMAFDSAPSPTGEVSNASTLLYLAKKAAP